MSQEIPITVAHGDGIGPEIIAASFHKIRSSGAERSIETVEIGEKVYLRDHTAGIDPKAWKSLRRTKVFYKTPITTPQGGLSKRKAGTKEFARAAVARMGSKPERPITIL